jgi:heme exporter protein B
MRNWIELLLTLTLKDIGLEIRTKEVFTTIILFSILVVTTFAITSNSTLQISKNVGAGIIWASVIFSGSIAMIKFFASEVENETLDAMLLMPVPRELIFFSKLLSFFIFLSISEMVIFATFSVFYNVNVFSTGILLTAVIFNFGFSSIGTFFGTIVAKAKSKETLLALLLVPIVIPLAMFAVEITSTNLAGQQSENIKTWIGLAISFDIIFLVLLTFLFEKIVEE